MNRIFIILLAIFLSLTAIYSQVPQTISWQGIIQDSDGNNLTGNHNLTIQLYDVPTGGTALWTELHNAVAVDNGLVNLTIGGTIPINIAFDKQYWLEITVGGSTPLPRIKLSSVPYSLYSARTSGVIINDSLVLKDAQGVTKMVLNPNTGTFKMMDNDTVWYEISVNSPVKTKTKNSDGTYTVQDGGDDFTTYYPNGNIKEVHNEIYDSETETTIIYHDTYDEDGNLIEETDVEEKNGENGVEISEATVTYDANGNVIQEALYESIPQNSGIDETVSIINYNENGDPTSMVELKTNNDGSIQEIHTNLETGEVFEQKMSNEEFLLKYDEDNSLNVTPTNDGSGYSLGLQSDFPNNPSISFTNDIYGGYVSFLGESFGLSSLYNFAQNIFDVYGNSNISGDLNVGGTKNFRIDHPDDPDNKYLYHSCIESDEVLNQYSGNVITNADGIAVVTLADYIQKINIDFRYQLTVIGDFAQAIISKEITNNQFEIKTDKPNIKVSWMIVAKRNDKYMQENPFEPVRLKDKEKLNKINHFINKSPKNIK